MAHTHTNASLNSSTGQADHVDGLAQSITCGWKATTPKHQHDIIISVGDDSHNHTLVLSFGSSELGSPWNNHTHTITKVSCTINADHHHHYTSPTELGRCAGLAGYDCNGKADHQHNHTLSIANQSGHTHAIGSPITGTANVGGTPENHTHNFSFNTSDAGNHTHSVGGSVTIAACGQGANHTHSANTTTGSTGTAHSVSGTSGSGGESAAAKPFIMDGLVFTE